MYQTYREIFEANDQLANKMDQVVKDRDLLVQRFDREIGSLRLPVRLRRRSGGMLAWRNIAHSATKQRDLDLAQYEAELRRLPQPVRRTLLNFDKERLIVNLNLSLLQHEKKQVANALEKIAFNSSHLESQIAHNRVVSS